MRWSMNLVPAFVVLGEELHLGPDEAGRSARVTLQHAGDGLEIVALVEGLAADGGERFDRGIRLSSAEVLTVPSEVEGLPAHPEWFLRRHMVVMFNPNHDHATRWTYHVDDAGQTGGEADFFLAGEECGDRLSARLPAPPPGDGQFESLGDRRFRAVLRLPLSAVFTDPHRPAGLRIKENGR